MTAAQIDKQSLILKSLQIGMNLFKSGRFSEAAECFSNITAQIPDLFQAQLMCGLAYNKLSDTSKAAEYLENAVALEPDHEVSRSTLANIYFHNKQYDEAKPHFEALLQHDANHHETHHRLSVIAFQSGTLDQSISHIAQALTLAPNERAYWSAALNICDHDTSITRHKDIQDLMLSQLGSDEHLSIKEFDQLLLLTVLKGEAFGRLPIDDLHPGSMSITQRDTIWEEQKLYQYFDDTIIKKLIASHYITADLLEFYLTGLRRYLMLNHDKLENLSETHPALEEVICCLGIQCWHNDFAFILSDDETAALEQCIKRAETTKNDTKTRMRWALISTYKPLHSLDNANDILALADDNAPEFFKKLCELQISNPLREQEIIPTIPCLKPLANEVSIKVAGQYKEHPYPRWQKLKRTAPLPLATILKQMFGELRIDAASIPERQLKWLIAGCGTGQHALYSYQRYENHNVKAIDISLTSLGYAIRKTQELGIEDLEFMQADILDVAEMNESYDVIESAGVLHHMADPFAGWQSLTNILNPGGYMAISLYSELAREQVVKARQLIETLGFGSDSDAIREFREYVMNLPSHNPLRDVMKFNDFYNISECRDLLFHVQEHRFTIPKIHDYASKLGLEFIGFNINNPKTMTRFIKRFGEQATLNNFNAWQAYEQDNPGTFSGMYHMWFRKPGMLQ